MSGHPFDATEHFRAEMARIAGALAALLRAQRERGRSPLGDAVQGLVVEEGEAEGLALRIAQTWSQPPARGTPELRRAAGGAGNAPAATPRGVIDEIARRAAAQGASLPLLAASIAFALEPHELDALLLSVAVEVDARFGRLVGYLNDHVQRTRPTLGLVAELAALDGGRRIDLPAVLDRPIFRDGLLVLEEAEGPIPSLAFRAARDLVGHLSAGRARVPEPVAISAPDAGRLSALVLTDDVRRAGKEWAGALRAGTTPPVLVLAGLPGAGRATLAAAIAGESGRSLVRVPVGIERPGSAPLLGRREARFLGHRAALLLEVEGESVPWGQLAGIDAPLLVSCLPNAVEKVASGAPSEPLVLRLEDPGVDGRARVWRALLSAGARAVDVTEQDLSTLAARFRFRPGRIARIVRRARAAVSLAPDGERRLSLEALETACREAGASAMGPLAQKLPLPWRKADLIAPARVLAELDLAVSWIRHQQTVLDRWGFGRRIVHGRGLTALFAGPPGTGKTMGAQVLARELGVDAYRVDLSRVMSKYIGETEKNLGALFDEAAAAGAMLFFDEADAIFGKRSEVSDAHDRYANVEIGYLLQRMEEHDGITVLATNRQRDLDEAFTRRFHLILDFPMPEESDRLRIWKSVFPPEVAVDPAELATLAREYETSGGEIKNAALAAAYMAASEDRPLSAAHLRRAVTREMIKGGKVVDNR